MSQIAFQKFSDYSYRLRSFTELIREKKNSTALKKIHIKYYKVIIKNLYDAWTYELLLT